MRTLAVVTILVLAVTVSAGFGPQRQLSAEGPSRGGASLAGPTGAAGR